MALRQYSDPSGRVWMVWNVLPRFSPGRSGKERRQDQLEVATERRGPQDRRGLKPPPEWLHGWLCFESLKERRRLCPIPKGWESAGDDELEKYRGLAAVTPPIEV